MNKINKTLFLLESLEYPEVLLELEKHNEVDEHFINQLFFKTESRLSMIEWLIDRYDPRLLHKKESEPEEDFKTNRVNYIKRALIRTGISFYSQNTKSNDLARVVEAQSGKDSAVDLVYKLAKFVSASQQVGATEGSLFQESVKALSALAENKKTLINKSPNLFSIDFPATFEISESLGRKEKDKKTMLADRKFNSKEQEIETMLADRKLKSMEQEIETMLADRRLKLEKLYEDSEENAYTQQESTEKEIYIGEDIKKNFKEALGNFNSLLSKVPSIPDVKNSNGLVAHEFMSLNFSKDYAKNLRIILDELANSEKLSCKLSTEVPKDPELDLSSMNFMCL